MVSERDQRRAKIEATHAQHDKEARKERKRRKKDRKDKIERELQSIRKHERRHKLHNGEHPKDQATPKANTNPCFNGSCAAKVQDSKDKTSHAHRPMPSGKFNALGL